MKRGSDSKQYTRDRKKLQRHKMRYMELREELQLAGEIPTEPSGAIRDERAQSEDAPQPALVAEAIRKGWKVPEERKQGYIEELGAVIDNPEQPAKVKVAAFNALRMADKDQWEREHPEEDAKQPVAVNIQVVNIGDLVPIPAPQREGVVPILEVVPSAGTDDK